MHSHGFYIVYSILYYLVYDALLLCFSIACHIHFMVEFCFMLFCMFSVIVVYTMYMYMYMHILLIVYIFYAIFVQ